VSERRSYEAGQIVQLRARDRARAAGLERELSLLAGQREASSPPGMDAMENLLDEAFQSANNTVKEETVHRGEPVPGSPESKHKLPPQQVASAKAERETVERQVEAVTIIPEGIEHGIYVPSPGWHGDARSGMPTFTAGGTRSPVTVAGPVVQGVRLFPLVAWAHPRSSPECPAHFALGFAGTLPTFSPSSSPARCATRTGRPQTLVRNPP
jgi:hypothetical protein